MARQYAGMAVISEGHKEVVNIRTAGAASKCSAGNAIRIHILIWPNSLKALFGTPLAHTRCIHKRQQIEIIAVASSNSVSRWIFA